MGMQTIEERVQLASGRRTGTLQKLEPHGDALGTAHEGVNEEDWKVEESWTAIVGYMAELSLPGEG